jgi:hypothetical protein
VSSSLFMKACWTITSFVGRVGFALLRVLHRFRMTFEAVRWQRSAGGAKQSHRPRAQTRPVHPRRVEATAYSEPFESYSVDLLIKSLF